MKPTTPIPNFHCAKAFVSSCEKQCEYCEKVVKRTQERTKYLIDKKP